MMRDVAKQAYEATKIGATGWMRPDATKGETLEGFQSVFHSAQAMQDAGLILIQQVHRESASGKKLIDAIQFMRAK
ncbi:hypothetical protein [Noviherbaspirillum galbum]|uniref:Uncharacterized protein n=1 Tax=Noviherbaspirillum galbum TaxID=2709383 RepID=A0A6B3SH39_9BURK|nr:hypothetical protein [Noviherbaspirillum galbum]NEX60171.1 hypothetical protein [Noviherbaspirillum galbum]